MLIFSNLWSGRRCLALFFFIFYFCSNLCNGAEVIAHRGFWTALEDSTQNSLAALEAALEAGFYGSETDVWVTQDNTLVIHHDNNVDGIIIEECNFPEIMDKKLSNGENIPVLEDFLSMLKNSGSETKLIIEIKYKAKDRGLLSAELTADMVSSLGLSDRIEYISFGYDILLRIKELQPDAVVYYLGGNFPPDKLMMDDVFLDYRYDYWNKNSSWLDEAHNLGLKTNVWTVDTRDQIYDFMARGIDYVTTNHPDLATEIKEEIEQTSRLPEFDEINDTLGSAIRYYDLYGRKIEHPIKGQVLMQVNRVGKSKIIAY